MVKHYFMAVLDEPLFAVLVIRSMKYSLLNSSLFCWWGKINVANISSSATLVSTLILLWKLSNIKKRIQVVGTSGLKTDPNNLNNMSMVITFRLILQRLTSQLSPFFPHSHYRSSYPALEVKHRTKLFKSISLASIGFS